MKHPVNPFKQALSEGSVQLGMWLGLANSYSAELIAGSGFDWLLIDGEHAPNDINTILSQLQALAAYPSEPVVRAVWKDTVLIKQLLDIGTRNLLIPMIETIEEAREMVAATRYPPMGIRGVGSALARASQWNRKTDYLHNASDEICLLLQIETLKGLNNLDAILDVEGVDGIFIGPADLSAALGHLGNPGHPEVQAIIEQAITNIVQSGKAAGILSADETLARKYLELGATFVAVGVDTTLLARTSEALLAKFKASDQTLASKASGPSVY
ncbi:4-hydroxy-2-oxo-heptane-1,7-dioate aldolase [Endozoicomonas montiporae]|uniref:4-hydroxy-2-oxo-heptane-1,7-dioate aldolase n=2 Tax=Endozoicomonas montiporae TaxID=1027273 RepID=A0A081MZK1_9GAMM|nr:4-hydroxy-2-oxoheptanedioate aldolase [Endozoicomonas montiporae]AMO54694.1 2,4-dihydroxyhept-2-ene-1,7-dioic acid aldolase [Endozoicomonas montiporae CL-33]KEQ11624.1 4-hydroxy-2-oxo-heptane-1,7-dioate aldolase [Endozoicomonas montiporae]